MCGVLMLRRKAYDRLVEWKGRQDHKSLLIRGQRQVGKTFIIREFSKTYENSTYVDLSSNARMRRAFRDSIEVEDVLEALMLQDRTFDPYSGRCLIILDEIQSSPWARQALKSFTEDGRFDVIASGSLPDVPLRARAYDESDERDERGRDDAVPLIPVGYEEHMRMYSLDFEEFLWAKGYGDATIAKVRESIRQRVPLSGVFLDAMNDEFREYTMFGGMPEPVSKLVTGEGLRSVIKAMDDVVASNYNDISKYAEEGEVLKIRKTLESIPMQLSQSNKKFKYSRIEGNRKSREGARKYQESLLWIEGSGIGNMCHQLRDITVPVSMSSNPDQFKVYISDTGMLVRMMDGDGVRAMDAIRTGDIGFNQGSLTENVVAECLMKSGIDRNYYIHRKEPGRMELDFVIDLGSETAAIEVKSGRDREAPSLSKTIGDGRFQRRLMFERSNISVDENGVEHYPLFAAAFVRDMGRSDDWVEDYSCRRAEPGRGL